MKKLFMKFCVVVLSCFMVFNWHLHLGLGKSCEAHEDCRHDFPKFHKI